MCFISIKMHVIYLYVNVMCGSVTRPVEWSGTLKFGITTKSELSSGIARQCWWLGMLQRELNSIGHENLKIDFKR
jgi:hypothetical protein